MSGRIRRRGSRHSRCRQDGHLSSATKLHLTLRWTHAAPPCCDSPSPAFSFSTGFSVSVSQPHRLATVENVQRTY